MLNLKEEDILEFFHDEELNMLSKLLRKTKRSDKTELLRFINTVLSDPRTIGEMAGSLDASFEDIELHVKALGWDILNSKCDF